MDKNIGVSIAEVIMKMRELKALRKDPKNYKKTDWENPERSIGLLSANII